MRLRRWFSGMLLVFALLFTAVAHAAVKPISGLASYYGRQHQGHRMANGRRFDRSKFTAACRRFPLGTLVRVTNLRNHKSVEVQITDRGPFGHQRRIIDLSEAAARMIGLIQRGVGRVRVEEVR